MEMSHCQQMSQRRTMNNFHLNRYHKFIDSLRNQVIEGYCEKHHILPRSLGGGDDPSNIICLTLRQHYIAHWMLWKAYGGAMAVAFDYMSGIKRYGSRLPSKTVEALRADVSKRISERIVSKATKQKQRDAKLGRKLSPEHVEKVRQSRIGKHLPEHWRKAVSDAKKGKATRGTGWSHSPETIEKLAASNRNRLMIVCPHCDKSVKDHGGAKRWHFDRCRERTVA